MSWLNAKKWSGRTQRMLGLGCYVNAVAVHTKKVQLPELLIKDWYTHSVQWMKSFGYEPKTLCFIGVEGFDDGDGYPFKSANRKIQKRGFGGIPHITIQAADPPGFRYWEPYVSVDLRNSLQAGSYSSIYWAWENSEKNIEKNYFVSLMEFAKQWDLLDYAKLVQDYSKSLPSSQALASSFVGKYIRKRGTIASVKGYPTKRAIDAGFNEIDFLRDIYPFQILSPVHLSWKMGNGTLKDWIESSSLNGELSLFSKDRWLWEISENKMDSVRNSLAKHNLLTLYLPDMNRILEDYANPS